MNETLPSRDIECRLVLRHDDFIMRNHRVHGVSVMPGVVFLDIVHRVLVARDLPHRHATFRRVLFSEPVVTTDGYDRELRVTLSAGEDGMWRARAESRWLDDGEPRFHWRENFRATLSFVEREDPASIDVAQLKAGATRRGDMEELYARARREDIRHGDAMTCAGPLYLGEGYMLAELTVNASSAKLQDGFHLHPAMLDASTIAGCGHIVGSGDEPFIPVFIDGFRGPNALRSPVYVYAPSPGTIAPTGDVIRSDYGIFDAAGRFLADFAGLSCKRIRHPSLIVRLTEEITSGSSTVARTGTPSIPTDQATGPFPDDAVAAYRGHLRKMVARVLDRQPARVPTNVGFYELGLDSVAMLAMAGELEHLTGTALYPTLLFEFTDIEHLAGHLAEAYGPPEARETAEDGVAGGETDEQYPVADGVVDTVCFRSDWAPLPATGAPHPVWPGDVVVLGAGEELAPVLQDAFAPRGAQVVEVAHGSYYEDRGAGGYRIDTTSRAQVGRLLAQLTGRGLRPTTLVHMATGPDRGDAVSAAAAERTCLTVWASAAAVADQRFEDRCALYFVYPDLGRPDPANAAVGAFMRTLSAETPAVSCRTIAIDDWTPSSVAQKVLAETGDLSVLPATRYRDGRREVSGLQTVEAPGRGPGVGWAQGGVYVVTGGAGGLGRILAGRLALQHRARLVLIGRSRRPDGLDGLTAEWESAGATARYIQADVTRAEEVAGAMDRARAEFGRIDGVFHCAGAVHDAVFFRKTESTVKEVLGAKVWGAVHLDAATKDDDLRHFVMFSSLAASMAVPGQCEYAYANAFLEEFASWRQTRPDRSGRTLAVGWPLWEEGGMTVAPEVTRHAARDTGARPLPTTVGLDLLFAALQGPVHRLVVAYGERGRLERAVSSGSGPGPTTGTVRRAAVTPQVQALTAPRGEEVDDDVAVVGLAGQYPQAADIHAFWQNLLSGRDAVVEIPPDRWDANADFHPEKGIAGKTYSRWGAFLDGADLFDPAFFGISRREAEWMDPQERLFLKTSWRAFEDAGYVAAQLAGRNVGVFVGVMWNHYQLFEDRPSGVHPPAMHAAVANRVSYLLDFRGPSVAVDTACSSSLSSIHLAVESLRRGECDMALAGGVNVTVHQQKYLQLAQGQFLSADGRCRSFGKGATGYVPGEGVGAALLKPLARAEADGDHVYGVVKASSLNHTGRTSGFTVPSPLSQAVLVKQALRRAGVDPTTVGYVEAHGTGTELGDPIEVEGLREAFADAELPARSCAIGSVKSNIGHLEGAAGIAGLTKVLLQMRHRTLVPSLHAAELNPHIRFERSPFYVQREAAPWLPPSAGGPLRAGVSAFGAGGANAHVVVEGYDDARTAVPAAPGDRLFVLSARDEATLRTYAGSFAAFLDRDTGAAADSRMLVAELASEAARLLGVPPGEVGTDEPLGDLGFDALTLGALTRRLAVQYADRGAALTLESTIGQAAEDLAGRSYVSGSRQGLSLDDVTFTLQVGRTPMPCRLAAVTDDIASLREALRRVAAGDDYPRAPWIFSSTQMPDQAPPTAEDCLALLRAGHLPEVAKGWVAGADVPWRRAYPLPGRDSTPRRIPLPTYPFREERCWVGRWRSDGDTLPTPVAAEGQTAEVGAGPPSSDVGLRVLDAHIALVTVGDGAGVTMFTDELLEGLESAFREIAMQPEVKVVVVTGRGSVFNMGATGEGLARLAEKRGRFTDVPFVYEGLLRCHRPVVAAIQGHASGGGLVFGLHADIVVMAREPVYSANFLHHGFTPGMGATYVLERRFGASLAEEMLYTGRPFTGEELERRGAQVTFASADDVLTTALEIAQSIADKPTSAVSVLKQELARRVLNDLTGVIGQEVDMHARVLGDEALDRVRHHFAPRGDVIAADAAPPPQQAVADPPAPAPALSSSVERDEVAAAVQDALCSNLYLEPSEIDPRQTFSEMGVDSVGAVGIIRDVNRRLRLALDSVTLYDRPTVPQLVDFVLAKRARATALKEAASSPAPEPAQTVEAPPAALGDRPAAAGHSVEPIRLAAAASATEASPPAHRREPEHDVGPLVVLTEREAPSPAGARASRQEPVERVERPEDIAVIGMSGRFPDAPDLAAFWANLTAGRCSIGEVPSHRWDLGPLFLPDRAAEGRTYSRWAALLAEVDRFDAPFFNVSRREAEAMDPQQRLFLQEAWAALEDAGYSGRASDLRCGVFVGGGAGDYLRLLAAAGQDATSEAFLGNSMSILPGRVAYFLDLTGPTVAIDSACSSSLVAVHLACESIRAGDCDMALAGGVAVMATPQMQLWTSGSGMLSPTGRCAPFDATADGIVLGEGVGVVVLKRLDRAMSDRDQIYAVVKASGVNGDGKTNGITAPSARSQIELLRSVYQSAGIGPETVGYLEAHGTGTKLGDPIEVKALKQVFGARDDGRPGCGLGSVKSNVGHTTMAAGIAGFIKVVLALGHGKLPPSLSFGALNPEIDLSGSPFHVVTELSDWEVAGTDPCVGAVSSFGFSGTNCHVVLAEAPKPPAAGGARPEGEYTLVPVSARSSDALARQLDRLAEHITPDDDLADVAFTLGMCRAHHPVRAAAVARSCGELVEQLRRLSQRIRGERHSADHGSRLTQRQRLIGVPQGAAAAGGAHGADAAERAAEAYVGGAAPEVAALAPSGEGRCVHLPTYPFAGERYWPEAPASGGARPDGTRPAAHPLLDAPTDGTSSGGVEVFRAVVSPDDWMVADHVVGGRPVLPASASMDLALLAGECSEGPASVRLSRFRWHRPIEVTKRRRLQLAVKGRHGWLSFELADEDGGECYVSGTVTVTAEAPTPETIDLEAIRARLTGAVPPEDVYARFEAAAMAYGRSYRLLADVRFGAGEAVARVLDPVGGTDVPGFALHPAQMDAALQTVSVLSAEDDHEALVPYSLDSLAVLRPLRQPLFSYAVRSGDRRFTVLLVDDEGRVCVRCENFTLRPIPHRSTPTSDGQMMVLVPGWRPAPPAPVADGPAIDGRRVAVVHTAAAGALADAILDHHGGGVRLQLDDEVDVGRLGEDVRLVYVLCLAGADVDPTATDTITPQVFRVVRALARGRRHAGLSLKLVVDGAIPVEGYDRVRWHAAGVPGLSQALAAEQEWSVGCIDIGPPPWRPADLARRLAAEPRHESLVALRGDRRLTRVFERASWPDSEAVEPFRSNGVYLVVGGAGGIGLALSRQLATTAGARLAWTGRRPRTADIERKLGQIEALGGEAAYLTADVTDAKHMREALAAVHRRFGPVNGAVHAGMVLADATIANMGDEAFAAAWAPKVTGSAVLASVLHEEPLDFLAFFSSAASFVRAGGQANYAAASTFEDSFALGLRGRREHPVIVVNWGYWGSVGRVADSEHGRRFADLGVGSIEPAEGFDVLRRAIVANVPQVLAIKAEPGRLADHGIVTGAPVAPFSDMTTGPEAGAWGSTAPDVRAYVRRTFAEVLKAREPDLDDRQTFENFGIDSLIGAKIVRRLEQDLGDLPATVLFEYMTIEALAGFLLEQFPARVAEILCPAARGEAPPRIHQPGPAPAQLPAPSPVVRAAARSSSEIAVVGVTGRYPMAPDLQAFWRNLRTGRNCVTEVPAGRWDWRDHYDAQRGRPNHSYGRWGGFLDAIDQFDAGLFNVLPREAVNMDPQERLFLETCWNLLEETGHLGTHTHESRTGVFVGVMYGSYGKLAAATSWPRGELAGAHSAYWSLANRVSYFFDFQGPSYAVDSACSSSLTAVHLACESIRNGECAMAIAGGVNLVLHGAHLVALSAMNMLATGDACRTFDEGADGYVPGEGVGAVLLKPLERALADGDRIWGVIKGSFVNAGGRTSGYTVPNPNAQSELVAEALRRAEVEPRTVTYVEAHGTGTALGDPIEVASLTRAFGPAEGRDANCAVGSVKANVGHLEGAAGVAGLTKVLLQIEHQELAPCANLKVVNPRIDFDRSPFYPVRSLTAWPRPVLDVDGEERVYPRRAGVSSFGAGGANAHIVVEEHIGRPGPGGDDGPEPTEGHLFVASAQSREQLSQLAGQVAGFLSTAPVEPTLRQLAYTSQVGRREMEERLAVLASSRDQLADRLHAFTRGENCPGVVAGTAGRDAEVRLLLAGEETAFVGRLLSRRDLPKLAQAWVQGLPVDWPALWPGSTPSRVAYPTYPFARRRYWLPHSDDREGVRRSVALDVSGDAFYLTDHRVRGARRVPGVAFLELARAACRDILEPTWQIEDGRWPSPLDLDQVGGGVTIDLDVEDGKASFRVVDAEHRDRIFACGGLSSLAPAAGRLLDLTALRERCPERLEAPELYHRLREGGLDYGPAFRVVRDVSFGTGECVAELRLPEPLVADAGSFGLHPALMDGALQSVAVLSSSATPYLPVGFERARVLGPLPAGVIVHVLERPRPDGRGLRRFDIQVADQNGSVLVAVEGLGTAPAMRPVTASADEPATVCRFSRPVWGRSPPSATGRPPGTVLVVGNDQAVLAATAARVAVLGGHGVVVTAGSDYGRQQDGSYLVVPGERDHYRRLIADLGARRELPTAVIHCSSPEPLPPGGRPLSASIEEGFFSLAGLSGALLEAVPGGEVRFVLAHWSEDGASQPHATASAGLFKTLVLEHERWRAVRVEVLGAEAASAEALARRLTDELGWCELGVAEIRYQGGERRRKGIEELTPAAVPEWPAAPVRAGGTYVITGGSGALGLHFAEFFARTAPVNLVLVGRSELDGRRGHRIEHLRRLGASVRYERADMGHEREVRSLVDRIRTNVGPIDGIVHAAGRSRDARFVSKQRGGMEAVIAPKVIGALALDEATREDPLDFFVVFSSVVAEAGNPGQADYSFANAFLNEFASLREQRRARGDRSGKTLSICWPLWREGGITVAPATQRLLSRRWGMIPMATQVGLRAFCAALAGDDSCVLVVEEAREPAGPATVPGATTAVATVTASSDDVEGELRRIASAFLLVDASDVDMDMELIELGFDSISLTDLINRVNERYGLDLLPTVLFESPTLAAFSRYLLENHAASLTATPPGAKAGRLTAATGAAAPDGWQARPSDALGDIEASRAGAPEIAIIGMAGRLPKSDDLPAFWEHLVAGRDLVGDVPADRDALRRDALTKDVRGGFLEDVDRFDHRLFGISPSEAALMDPQQRIFLETVWRVIENAGYRPSELAGSATGIFAGVSTSDYDDLLREEQIPVEAHTATGIAHSILANRASHVFDFRGPSEAIDSACSSSLVAIHRAVQAIARGECEMAIAGGVNVILSPGLFTAFAKSGMLSASGRCSTFDKGADGYVRGEGAGAVLLKPLERARVDGDHVYAVVRGSAVNHCGRGTSLTAPNPEAQAEVIVEAHRQAGIDPGSVTYVEAHGTGTQLGDPVEVEGLKKAFTTMYADAAKPVPSSPFVALGSVKTNIGHLEAAAGIAGVLKVLLCMEHAELPASLNFAEINPYIRLDGTPFYVNAEAHPWEGVADHEGARVLRAGVSSFGFGGTNAHLVLEARRPVITESVAVSGPQAIVLSAPTADALRNYARRMAAFLSDHPDVDLARVAYTLQVGREAMAERLAVLAADREGLVSALRAASDGGDAAPGARQYEGSALSDQPPPPSAADADASARAWCHGATVEWRRLWPAVTPRRTPLPGVPMAQTRHWLGRQAAARGEAPASQTAGSPGQGQHTRPVARRTVQLTAPRVKAAVRPAPVVARPKDRSGGAPPSGNSSETPLASAPPTASAEVGETSVCVARVVGGELCNILGVAPSDLDDDQPFGDLGLDSIYLMDLVRTINVTFQLDLKAAELYDFDTVSRLAGYVSSIVAGRSSAADNADEHGQPDRKASPAPGPGSTTARGTEASGAHAVQSLVVGVLDRELDPARTFAENGVTSFEMLRVVGTFEKQLGALPKTLLFDHPTPALLAAHLQREHGDGVIRRLQPATVAVDPGEDAPLPTGDSSAAGAGAGPLVSRKDQLAGDPVLAELVASLQERHGKEGGLAGRHIAPLIFMGSDRRSYFNFTRRDHVLLAWSYVGSAGDLLPLVEEWCAYAGANDLQPNLLSMVRLEQVGDIAFTATPLGAVQRLENLRDFTTAGARMSRLRYMVRRFQREGECRTVEYTSGSDSDVDRQVGSLIDRWCETKDMLNPYVAVVREEILGGTLDPRHRMFLTSRDGDLANAVIVTPVPSENGYLLDLEFYAGDMPLGGLEYAILRIIEVLVGEGCTMFSFGASFGPQVTDPPNANPAAARALAELRSMGVLAGNFQFKNKFRPTNLPLYLCQPVGAQATDLSSILLIIASPAIPEAIPAPAHRLAGRAGTAAHAEPDRRRVLVDHGYNPLAVPPSHVEVDLVTDSWAEQDTPFIRERMAQLRALALSRPDVDIDGEGTLPFRHLGLHMSGRSAEGWLCRAWPGAGRVVVQNSLFPTWSLAQLDHGFSPSVVRPAAADRGGTGVRERFKGDISLTHLKDLLTREPSEVAFVCVELCENAGGGYPISLANLRQVKELASECSVPLVLDASRLLENALFVAEEEDGHSRDDVWDVARQILELADTVTLSMSKDFAVDFGGIVATNDPILAERLHEQVEMRGREVSHSNRRVLRLAFEDRGALAELVRGRVAAVEALWQALAAGGVPVVAPASGHCVLIEATRIGSVAGYTHPVPAFLAWLYAQAGVRGAPHLSGDGSLIRLAVPLGMTATDTREAGSRIVDRLRRDGEVHDLVRLPLARAAPNPSAARYHPADRLPVDVRQAMDEGHRPLDENLAVLREHQRGVRRRLISLEDGDVEVFTAGRGPRLLFLHPFNIGAGYFAPQFEGLASRFELIVVHHPGVGATLAATDLSLRGLADLAHRTLVAADLVGPVHVCGASFGGLTAMAFALECPEITASLTLLGSSYKVGNRAGEMNRLSIVAQEDFDRLLASIGPHRLLEERDRLQQLLLRCESMDSQIGLRYLDEFAANSNLLARLPLISVPTLIIHGRHDTVIGLNTAHLLRGRIPNARYEEVADAGHFPSLTSSDHVNGILASFLTETAEATMAGDPATGADVTVAGDSSEMMRLVRTAIATILPGIEEQEMSGDKHLKDLGADSVERVEIIMTILRDIGSNEPISNFSGIPNIDQLVAHLCRSGRP